MAMVRLSNEVRAPADAVFDFADNHENYPRFFQGFTNFEWTSPRHEPGGRLKMEGKLSGIELPFEIETTEVIPERRISGVFVSGLRGHLDWDFEETEGSTWVTLTAEYELPDWFLALTGGRFPVDRDLCLNVERTLAALKEMVEARSAALK